MFLLLMPFLASSSDPLVWVDFIEPDKSQYEVLGIFITTDGYIVYEDFPENLDYQKQISISSAMIDMAGVPRENQADVGPRFIVATGPDGVATYYSDSKDYRESAIPDDLNEDVVDGHRHPLEAHSGIDSLMCVRLPLGDRYFAYLWYDPIEEITEIMHGEPVDIQQITTEFSFDLYPNPAVNFVKLAVRGDLSANCRIDIYDISGRSCKYLEFNGLSAGFETEIELSDLPGGMYLVGATLDDGRRAMRRLIINR